MARTRRTNSYRWYRHITTLRRRKMELRAVEQLRECGFTPRNRYTAMAGATLPNAWDDYPVSAWEEIRPWLRTRFDEQPTAWERRTGKSLEPCCYVHRTKVERNLRWRKVPEIVGYRQERVFREREKEYYVFQGEGRYCG